MKNGYRKKTVMIVEDEDSLRELLSDKFKDSGFKVCCTHNAEDGIKIALKNRPDLILLDIILPKMDGLTMLKKLRQDKWGSGVPVIILSNLNDQKKVSEALKIGVYDFLIKSNVKLADVVEEVREVLN